MSRDVLLRWRQPRPLQTPANTTSSLIGAIESVILTYRGFDDGGGGGGTVFTFPDLDIGEENSEREVWVNVVSDILYFPSAITVQGIQSYMIVTSTATVGIDSLNEHWFAVRVPTGTTATIVVTLGAGGGLCFLSWFTTSIKTVLEEVGGGDWQLAANATNVTIGTGIGGVVAAGATFGNSAELGAITSRGVLNITNNNEVSGNVRVQTFKGEFLSTTSSIIGVDANGGGALTEFRTWAWLSKGPLPEEDAWNPSHLIQLGLWYDASDSSTITSTGGLVDQWRDKSEYDNHLSAVLGARPQTGAASLNGLNVFTFLGTDDVLTRTASINHVNSLHQTGASVFVVRKFDAAGAQGVFWTATTGGSVGDNCSMGRSGGNVSGIYGDSTVSSVGKEASFSDTDNTNWHIAGGVWANSASREFYLDGTLQASNVVNCASLQRPITSIFVGQNLTASRAASQFLTGKIAEVVFVQGSDTTVRQMVEGYLAWKWGLADSLPIGHPYKNSPP